jgi:hypothetical protein
MTITSSGTLAVSAINTELGRASNASFSFASAVAGSYGTINTGGTHPNNTTPHALSEWYSYSHGIAFTTMTYGACSTPGDGGGYIEIVWAISGAQGGEYITIEGNVSGGGTGTTTGPFGPSTGYTASPAQYNIGLGAGATGSVTVKLYSSGNVLLDTESIGDGAFPT